MVSGMIANQERQDIIANNIANVNTTGFKKDIHVRRTFDDYLTQARDQARPVKPINREIYNTMIQADVPGATHEVVTAFKQGDLRITNNTLDAALMGKGFFAVQTNEGVRYTRDGSFRLNNQNQLVTSQGYRVLGEGGEGGEGTPITINGTNVTFQEDGSILVDGLRTASFKLVDFSDYTKVQKEGESFITYAGETQEILPAQPDVEQGYLEGSNVNAITEMTAMLFNNRHYELSAKTLKSVENTVNRAIVELSKFK